MPVEKRAPPKVVVAFQSGGMTDVGPLMQHEDRMVARPMCIPDLFDWTTNLRWMQRQRLGY